MLCGSLEGRGVWGRMDTCICMTESPYCPPETSITLLIDSPPVENKKLEEKKRLRDPAESMVKTNILLFELGF